ncbi:transposase [Paenibacillus sp. 481]|uniref:transposase n=1 Tax=Paenibacillus sp. 481 TaxID=2835869 RepID=UPI003FA73B30|nr:transposase [Paenibacillus sp. 481]
MSRRGNHYHQIYTAKTKDCKACPLRDRCFTKSKPYRSITSPYFMKHWSKIERDPRHRSISEFNVCGEYGVKEPSVR